MPMFSAPFPNIAVHMDCDRNEAVQNGRGLPTTDSLGWWAVLAQDLRSVSLNAQKHCPPYTKDLLNIWTPPNSGCARWSQ